MSEEASAGCYWASERERANERCVRKTARTGGGTAVGLGGSLRLDQEPPEEGDGERGSRISSGIGLGGIGEGSCQRYKILAFPCDKGEKRKRTRNSKLTALSVMTVISWAVDALCSALPGLAKETLPTRTLCTTVLSTCQTSICFVGENKHTGTVEKISPGIISGAATWIYARHTTPHRT